MGVFVCLTVWKSGLSAAILGRYHCCVVSWHIDRSRPVPNNSFCQACACHCVMMIIFLDSLPNAWSFVCWKTITYTDTVKKYIWGRAFHFYVQWHISSNWKTALALIEHKHWIINSLWSSDTTIWRQRSESTLAQVMACCLTAPSHYLNQCWLIISEVQWHSY